MVFSKETLDAYRQEINQLLGQTELDEDEWWIKFSEIHARMKQEPGYDPPHFRQPGQ